jgi:hypothetical protein
VGAVPAGCRWSLARAVRSGAQKRRRTGRARGTCVIWAAWPFAVVTRLQVIAVMRSDDEAQSWVPLSHIYTKSSRNGMPGAVLIPTGIPTGSTGSSSDALTMGGNYSIVVIHEGFLENKWGNYSVHSAGCIFKHIHVLHSIHSRIHAHTTPPRLTLRRQCPATAACHGSSDQTCLYRRRASTRAVRR